MRAQEVFEGSDPETTKAYYASLARRGAAGDIAANLFRAQKCSTRAKRYRGGIRGVGSYKSMSYARKTWAMENLCSCLSAHGKQLRIKFGWKQDPDCVFGDKPSWVIYIDLPQGQVSFHSPTRLSPHGYRGKWDRERKSEERVLAFCDAVWEGTWPKGRAAACTGGQLSFCWR
jgi:hypothetical protein